MFRCAFTFTACLSYTPFSSQTPICFPSIVDNTQASACECKELLSIACRPALVCVQEAAPHASKTLIGLQEHYEGGMIGKFVISDPTQQRSSDNAS